MNNCNLDERQLWIRGDAFKHGLMLLGFLLLLDAFLKGGVLTEEGFTLVEGMWGNILFIVITVSVCEIEMILREAIDLENKSNIFMIFAFLAIGTLLLIMGSIEIITQNDIIIQKGSLTADGAELLMSICWIFIGVIGILKMKRMKAEE